MFFSIRTASEQSDTRLLEGCLSTDNPQPDKERNGMVPVTTSCFITCCIKDIWLLCLVKHRQWFRAICPTIPSYIFLTDTPFWRKTKGYLVAILSTTCSVVFHLQLDDSWGNGDTTCALDPSLWNTTILTKACRSVNWATGFETHATGQSLAIYLNLFPDAGKPEKALHLFWELFTWC